MAETFEQWWQEDGKESWGDYHGLSCPIARAGWHARDDEIRDRDARIAELEKDRQRLITANEHWHTRVSQLLAQVEVLESRVEELEGE